MEDMKRHRQSNVLGLPIEVNDKKRILVKRYLGRFIRIIDVKRGRRRKELDTAL